MDALVGILGYLAAPFALALVLGVFVWPLVWTWLVIRAFRDLHRIADDIGRIRETAWYQIDAIRSTPPPREVMQGSVSNSAFGR